MGLSALIEKWAEKQANKAIARITMRAETGNPDSQFTLGKIQWQRVEVLEAVKWLSKASDQGHQNARALLNDILADDE